VASHNSLIIVDDSHVHINADTTTAKNFMSIIADANFQQHVSSPTHLNGNTLDLVMSASYSSLNVEVTDIDCSVSSDHFAALFRVSAEIPPATHGAQMKVYRQNSAQRGDGELYCASS
jgi:YbbR domain-containing protein